MDKAVRIVAWLCIFGTLLTGCYSHNVITGGSPKSEYEVSFRLKDGTYVLSRSYERIENEYKVEGNWVQQNPPTETDFSGILLDAQIKEIVTDELDAGETVGGVLLGMAIAAVVITTVMFPKADWGKVFSMQ